MPKITSHMLPPPVPPEPKPPAPPEPKLMPMAKPFGRRILKKRHKRILP